MDACHTSPTVLTSARYNLCRSHLQRTAVRSHCNTKATNYKLLQSAYYQHPYTLMPISLQIKTSTAQIFFSCKFSTQFFCSNKLNDGAPTSIWFALYGSWLLRYICHSSKRCFSFQKSCPRSSINLPLHDHLQTVCFNGLL